MSVPIGIHADVDQPHLHALGAVPAIDRQRAGGVDRLAAACQQRLAERLVDARNAIALSIVPSPERSRARTCAWPTGSA